MTSRGSRGNRGNRMRQGELVSEIARRTGLRERKCRAAVAAFIEVVSEEIVSGTGTVEVLNLGVWERRWKSGPRIGGDPITHERIPLPPKYWVRFRAARGLNARVQALKPPAGEGG